MLKSLPPSTSNGRDCKVSFQFVLSLVLHQVDYFFVVVSRQYLHVLGGWKRSLFFFKKKEARSHRIAFRRIRCVNNTQQSLVAGKAASLSGIFLTKNVPVSLPLSSHRFFPFSILFKSLFCLVTFFCRSIIEQTVNRSK